MVKVEWKGGGNVVSHCFGALGAVTWVCIDGEEEMVSCFYSCFCWRSLASPCSSGAVQALHVSTPTRTTQTRISTLREEDREELSFCASLDWRIGVCLTVNLDDACADCKISILNLVGQEGTTKSINKSDKIAGYAYSLYRRQEAKKGNWGACNRGATPATLCSAF